VSSSLAYRGGQVHSSVDDITFDFLCKNEESVFWLVYSIGCEEEVRDAGP
jgi:hypothetical protein